MIRGVTHEADGQPIIRLAKAYKVSIGIPAGTDGKNYPEKSDHFHIRAKNGKGEWVDDKAFMEQLQRLYMTQVDTQQGKVWVPLREFDIVFLSDHIDDIFKTEYAWWAASEKKCSGDGINAQRKVSALPEKDRAQYKDASAIPWKPCGDKPVMCPELDKGICKPSGELMFIFKDRPTMGSVATFSTTSYESIRRIHSSLLQIQSVTGGRLRGIPLKIVVRPGKTRYQQDGKAKTGNAFFVNIEFRQEDHQNLVKKLIEYSSEYEHSLRTGRRMIAENTEEEVIEVENTPEAARAGEMTAEFFPENRSDVKTAAGSPATPVVAADEQVITQTFNALGLNPAQRETLFQSLKGDIGEIRMWITEFAVATEKHRLNAIQIQEFYTRIVVQPANLKDAIEKLATPSAESPKRGRPRKPGTPAATDAVTPPATQQPGPSSPKPEPETATASAPVGQAEWEF